MNRTRMFQECPVYLVKLPFFIIQVKIIQELDFDNWHPLKFVLLIILRYLYIFSSQFVFKNGNLITLGQLFKINDVVR